tara:strand:+ start:605 stop:835 length:231 start_codon:yes stop_codon:yes gene_type:complete
MGSGESGETADSVKTNQQPLFKIMVNKKDDKKEIKQEDEADGWMFSTFEQKHQSTKVASRENTMKIEEEDPSNIEG